VTLLPGHRAARLTVLDCGLFDVGGGRRIIGIPAFVVTTDRGAPILIDGGFPPGYDDAMAAEDGLPAFGRLVGYSARQSVTGQLALLGLTPGAIALHVLTHGHIDHVGALPLIACPLALGQAERALPRPPYFGQARRVAWPDVPTHLVEGETAVCEGLTLIPTPGHTPGHLSVRVDLAEGTVILAGDAINRAGEPAEGYPDAIDPATAARSGAALMRLCDRLAARLIWGHDPDQWPALPKAPMPLVPA
jgi:N-acyl homoserine lactone hydrolase